MELLLRERLIEYCSKPHHEEKLLFFKYPLTASGTKYIQFEFSTDNLDSPSMNIYDQFRNKIEVSSEDLSLIAKCVGEEYFNNNQDLELSSTKLEFKKNKYFKWTCKKSSQDIWIGSSTLNYLVSNSPFYDLQLKNLSEKCFKNILVDAALRFREYSTIDEVRSNISKLLLYDAYYVDILLQMPILLTTLFFYKNGINQK